MKLNCELPVFPEIAVSPEVFSAVVVENAFDNCWYDGLSKVFKASVKPAKVVFTVSEPKAVVKSELFVEPVFKALIPALAPCVPPAVIAACKACADVPPFKMVWR